MKSDNNEWKEIKGRLKSLFKKNEQPENFEIAEILNDQTPEMMALALEHLDPEIAIKAFNAADQNVKPAVMDKVNPQLGGKIATKLDPEELDVILRQVEAKNAASILAESSKNQKNITVNPKIIKEAAKKNK